MMQRRATRLVTTLPFEMRRDLVILGRKHNDEYRGLMSEDRGLREAAARFYRSLLQSPRRRGRPRDETTSRACDLLATLSVTHPDWPPSRRWGRVYPVCIPKYSEMSHAERRAAQLELRSKVHSRRKHERRKAGNRRK